MTIVDPKATSAAGQPPAAEEGRSAPEQARLYNTGVIRLLVIDDDASIGRLIEAALAQHQFVIDVVAEPKEIEQQLQKTDYHLIILDYVLPGLDTKQVLGWLESYQPDAGIIVITAFPSIDSALLCLRAHTFDYLAKPFPVESLQRSVIRCLESRGLLRLS
jgi:DNA-binding NtrC family response regulator